MTRAENRERIRALSAAIREHDRRYYVDARPTVSDEVYDALFRELVELERAQPDLVAPDSPTQRVGGDPASALDKFQHEVPMLSLEATREVDEIREFDERVRRGLERDAVAYVAEPKFDGVSLEVVYDDGILTAGATRGDGRIGEEVTANVRTMQTLPLRLIGSDWPSHLVVRGEALMHLAGFQDLNDRLQNDGKEVYSNPRNAAAGAIRQLDPAVTAARPMMYYAYDIVLARRHGLETEWAVLAALRSWGFQVDDSIRRSVDIEGAIAYHTELFERRDELPFEIDGVVIKVDELAAHDELGARSRSPRWAVAFKFEPRQEVTVVERIAVQVGRTGKLTPVAMLRPVNVGGVTVARATLHNADEVERKGVREGDTVRVRRAGDVIPEIAEVVQERRLSAAEPFVMPDRCPICDSEVVRQGAYHMCTGGYDCPAQLNGLLEHYGSRGALDIAGLGEKTVTLLVEAGLVHEPADLYGLTPADIEPLERFAEKSANALVDAIAATREPALDRLLFALGIPLVGQHLATVLADAFGDLDRLQAASADELVAVHEVGPELASAVQAFFSSERHRARVDRLRAAGVTPVWKRSIPATSDKLGGKKIVFTGTLEHLTRVRADELARAHGARPVGSVSKSTDYLVAGRDAGSKLTKARALGVEILTERAFLELVGENAD